MGINRLGSESHLHDVLLGLELSLHLPACSHDVVFGWRRLLHSILNQGWSSLCLCRVIVACMGDRGAAAYL